ncbi:hypothetical protein ACJIZ3_018623 [Penstemon smallii]|uniref:Uncharacterized protein n=1 Tax=Penstemon smallii TaxID=265156 RepID=A0ABD3SYU1_9LAMI
MSTVQRKRTRSQWDTFYRNLHNEKRKSCEDCGGTGGREKEGVRSVIDSKPITIDIEQDESSRPRGVKRIRNGFQKCTNGKKSNLVSVVRGSRGNKKLDTRAKFDDDSDSDSDVQFLGEEVSNINGSSLKSGSESKAGNLEEVVSFSSGRNENTRIGDDDDDVRPQIEPLEDNLVHHDDVSVDSDSYNSVNSSESETETETESESSSEEEDGTSDEDFKEDEDSSSDDSDCDDNVKKSSIMNGKKEIDIELEKDDGCSYAKRSVNLRKQDDNIVLIIDEEEKYPRGKEKSGVEKECDYEINVFKEKSRSNKGEDMVFIVDYKKKLPGVRKSSRINGEKKFGGLEILVDCDMNNDTKQPQLGKSSPPLPIPDCNEASSSKADESESLGHDGTECVQKSVQKGSKKTEKHRKKKSHAAQNIDLIEVLVDAIDSLKEEAYLVKENIPIHTPLPSKFRFEDEVQPLPEKSEWEKEMDSLFCNLELGLQESEIDSANSSVNKDDDVISTEIDRCPATYDGRGEHEPVLDEQIGLMCKNCNVVILDIKHILPSFYTPTQRRQDWKEFNESPTSIFGNFQFDNDVYGPPDSYTPTEGTVWELIPGVQKQMFPHQREGFEFMWRNIAGDIRIDQLNSTLSDDGRGCIISHAPGTGKTRLTLVFLQAFMKLYPTCRPVIVAPCGMLRTWEDEFLKWKVDLDFHNMNSKDLSGNESQICRGGVRGMSIEYIRMVKLYSWIKGRSVLGISYRLFEILAGENGKNEKKIKELLLERPGLLVLDEGHTPRNEQSFLWRALTNVSTQRRIILSGTPFQNNFTELKNTLCLVNPKFIDLIESEIHHACKKEKRGRKSKRVNEKWMNLTSSIGKNEDEGLKKLQKMIGPFVHVHKGTILQESLPGLMETTVFLHPSELQKTLLKIANKVKNIFERTRLVSLISIHPSMVVENKRFLLHEDELRKIESNLDVGVKANFIIHLIKLADALKERVLIFSQFLDPLDFIKNQLESLLKWKLGREVLYMDGQIDGKQRQGSIASLNDFSNSVKVLLASERSCSEGINLVGASRVVLIDTVWNPSVEKQAIRRAYRLGQKKVVYVYRLMISGFEVRQFELQTEKDRISQLLFSSVDELSGTTGVVSEDKVLEAMHGMKNLRDIFEKTVLQPKESEMFGLVDL